LASLGLVGMAIALAAKDTVANLFGSLVIFSDKPFKIGDWIKTSNAEGIVEAVGIRSTKIRTFAQALISVPNASLANNEILNWSKMGKRRIKMDLGLTYGTTTKQMNAILRDIRDMLQDDIQVHQETIHIYFTDFNDSSLGIFCYFFTKSTNWAEYMRVREEINLKIMRIVEKNDSSFAFPTQSIYIENNEEIN
jgi:MscS family membrane protein